MTILSSIATPRVVNMTTSRVANDDKVITVISFPFHCTKPSMWYSQLQEARCIQNMSRWAQCSEYVPLTRQCFCVFHWEYSRSSNRQNIPRICPMKRHWSTHWDRDKMVVILQTTCSNALSSKKGLIFWFKFHWSLLLKSQLMICQHWFR